MRLALNSGSPYYFAKGKVIVPTSNVSLFYDPPKLVHSCRVKPVKEVSPKHKLTEQEWGLSLSVRLVLISDQSNEIKRNSAVL